MPQFEEVSSRYGAPMGRRTFGIPQNTEPKSIRLFRVRLNGGGYDNGGAYWGIGQPLWCATDNGGYRQFVRAWSRKEAAHKLEIENEYLKRKV